MREYECHDPIGPSVVVRTPETRCLFCDHCYDVWWDYSSRPYLVFCNKHEDVTKVGGHIDNCPDFLEGEKDNGKD